MKATTEVKSRRFAFLLLVPALLCLPHVAFPQDYVSPQVTEPIVLGARKASRLVVIQVRPEYPVLAKINYIQGRVRLEVEVKSDGKIGRTHVMAGNPILAASVLKSIRYWRYRPLLAASGPSGFLTEVVFNFALRTKALELGPTQAERDLARQIKPPQVSGRPSAVTSSTFVHMRVLVSDRGEVIDSGPSADTTGDLRAAQEIVRSWTFRPAFWGSLPIPWYVDVEVPVDVSPNPIPTRASWVSP